MSTFTTEWPVQQSWHYQIVLLSYCISFVGAFTSLQLMRQRTGSTGWRNWSLLIGASISLAGVGIWSMHMVGMSAITYYSNGTQLKFGFNIGTTIASLIAAITVVAVAFYICSSSARLSWNRIIIGGMLAGAGVGCMHYLGMYAMVIRAHMMYNIGLVVLSCALGVIASTAALVIFFKLESMWKTNVYMLVACALIMGLAVNSVHYTGIGACEWTDSIDNTDPDLSALPSSDIMMYAALSVAGGVCALLLAYTLYTAYLNKLDATKSSTLLLHALVSTEHGEILCTLQGKLPQFTIDTQYIGYGSFDEHCKDFLRMYKVMQTWSRGEAMLAELQKRRATNANTISSYNVTLFEQFLTAVKDMIADLNIDTTTQQMCVYYKPINHSVVLVMRANDKDTHRFTSTSRYKFAPHDVAARCIDGLAGVEGRSAAFVDDMNKYYEQVNEPVVPPAPATHTQSRKRSVVSATQHDTTAKQAELTVLVGLLYTRATGAGVELMVNASGPLFIPCARFTRPHQSNHHRSVLEQYAIAAWSQQPRFITHVRNKLMIKTSGSTQTTVTQLIIPGSTRKFSIQDDNYSHDMHSPPVRPGSAMDIRTVRSPNDTYLRSPSNTYLTQSVRAEPRKLDSFTSMPVHSVDNTPVKRPAQPTEVSRTMRSPNVTYSTDSVLNSPEAQARDYVQLPAALQLSRHVSAPTIVVNVPGQIPAAAAGASPAVDVNADDTVPDAEYLSAWTAAVDRLGQHVGTSTDLTGVTLNSTQPIVLQPNVHLYLFVVSTMKSNQVDPYTNNRNLSFIPLHIFDIHSQAHYNTATPADWLHRAVEDTLESKTNKTSRHSRQSRYDSVDMTAAGHKHRESVISMAGKAAVTANQLSIHIKSEKGAKYRPRINSLVAIG